MEATSSNFLAALSGWAQGLLAPLLALGISGVYFLTSPKSESLIKRLLASAHGVAIAILYMAAMIVFWSHKANESFGTPYLLSLSVPLILIVVSFFAYRGRKAIHLLQVLNLLCLAWTLFIGSMAVTGNWL